MPRRGLAAGMTPWSRAVRVAVFGLVALFLAPLPAFAAGAPTPHGAPASALAAPPGASAFTPRATALVAAAHAEMAARHIPATHVLLPNFNARFTSAAGYLQPLYPTAPAPMGLGDFGIVRSGHTNVGTITYTDSVKATVRLNSVDPFYLASTSPDIFTMQLNTVATHVTVLGNSSGEYWIQNVPVYFAGSQTLFFEDNIWNFSAPGAGMLDGTLYNFSGNLIAPVFYYALGPTFHMPTPFTVTLYNNLTVSDLRPTVWFNYSITAANGSVLTGSFDKVEFNSATHPTHAAAMPTFQINGRHLNPIGLLNDAEIMLGGPGGGSTTTINDINATMGLWLRSNATGKYGVIPAGYSFGTDTGETSEGIAEWATSGANPVAVLGPGPSLLQPLWGLAGTKPGFQTERFTVTPSNAFAFGIEGSTFRPKTASWAPVPTSGAATYRLAAGHDYTFEFLLSDHKPMTVTLTRSASTTVTLAYAASMGVYTPLWAWNDAQLSAISVPGGAGTFSNPYVLDHQAFGPLNPLFGEFNDFYYPVFPGLLLANTDDFVSATGLSDFPVTYSITPEAQFSTAFGTPLSNNLGLEFYNTSHVSLMDNPQITGWFFVQDPYFSNVLFWNSSHDLVGGNAFQVQSTGLQLFGGTDNVVWGNTFTSATTTAADPTQVLNSNTQTGALLYENGDLTYNNAFDTVYTAYTPTFNLYTGAFAVWSDRWNVSVQPANLTHHFNGWGLSGNILGLTTQSGNFWQDYGTPGNPYGVLPYDEYGAISIGGDYHPLLTYTLHRITFDAVNLTSGATNWSVTIGGYTQTTSGLSLTFWEPSGTYAFVVGHAPGHTPHPHQGAVTVGTHSVVRSIVWT